MKQDIQKLAERAEIVIAWLEKATKGMVIPAATAIVQEFGRDPFLVLISCLLSLRTKDLTSLPASQRLFALARTPHDLLQVPISEIEKLIFPVGFYRRKAQQIHDVSRIIIDRFGGLVPSAESELLTIKGVGPKTANLVLGEGFNVPAICVDTHVHRISNRLGLVNTKTVEETEVQLKKVLPKKYWIEYNKLIVMWGQNICVPISPKCSQCVVSDICPRVGVTKSR